MSASGSSGSSHRRVIGTEHVTQAQARGLNRLEILPGDIVTALARESAQTLGIQLVDGPIAKPVLPRADTASRTQRQLFQRSPKWMANKPRVSLSVKPIPKLALIGAGGVGANIAHLAANSNLAKHISIIDIAPGIAAATALDLQHCAGITRSTSRIEGSENLQALTGADVVVVTAGKPRTPGMSRDDLLAINKRVIESSAEGIKTFCPGAIVIVVTNPLDEMTFAMLKATGFPREKVLGMAGTLDSSRFRVALAAAAAVSAADVSAIALGSHGDEMVPVTSMARIKGRPLESTLSADVIKQCVKRAVHGGGEVVALRKTGSATLAPAHSVIEVLEHISGARSGAIPVSVLLEGEYGLQGMVMGVPLHLGPRGMISIEEYRLLDSEQAALAAASQSSAARQASL